MIQTAGFGSAFVIHIGEEHITRHGWFDLVERVYIPEKRMKELYSPLVFYDVQAKKDMYIPVPVIYERDIIRDFLEEYELAELYPAYNGFQTRQDKNDFLNYFSEKDGQRPWLREAYFAYYHEKRSEAMNRWIFDNRIEYAVPLFPVGSDGPDDLVPRLSLMEQIALCERHEEDIKEMQRFRRTPDNRIVEQTPYYLAWKEERE